MIEIPEEVTRRRIYTEDCWVQLRLYRDVATRTLADITERACVYVTGSLARDEAGKGSDIDLFIVDQITDSPRAKLTAVEYARLVSALDELRANARFRPFSRGGFFLKVHSFDAMVAKIGDPDDDAQNAFTARMLLLINSRSLINQAAYDDMRRRALDAYWLTAGPERTSIVIDAAELRFPVMLINDLLRWWGVVALNFERTHRFDFFQGRLKPMEQRRVANLKLRYARMLAVYSVLMAISARSTEDGISRHDTEAILDMTPLERLLDLGSQRPDLARQIESLIHQYADYLAFMSGTEDALHAKVAEDDAWKPIKARAYTFHRDFSLLYYEIGKGKLIFDYCTI